MLLSPPVNPLDPPPLALKPKQHGRRPAKTYEKSRSSQRIEDQKNPPPAKPETIDETDELEEMDKHSDNEDNEAQVRDELEPELSELTQTSNFLTTSEDPQSYEEAISSIDQDEWRAAMQVLSSMWYILYTTRILVRATFTLALSSAGCNRSGPTAEGTCSPLLDRKSVV